MEKIIVILGPTSSGKSEVAIALAQKFNVVSIPNFVLFKEGKKAEQFIGAMPVEEFEKRLKGAV